MDITTSSGNKNLSTDHEKPWVIVTGASRGIGAAIVKFLSSQVKVFAFGRQASIPFADQVFEVDLAAPLSQDTLYKIKLACTHKKIWGFLHCAGMLGPVGSSNENYAEEFTAALHVNFISGVEMFRLLFPNLQADKDGNTPFVFHLTSGAAKNPYVGWEAYCASKAAMLAYFQCLAKAYDSATLSVLSVAPGTVNTGMMQSVLNADPAKFPAVEKFKKLQVAGELVNPDRVGKQIADILLAGKSRYQPLHGQFFDLRNG